MLLKLRVFNTLERGRFSEILPVNGQVIYMLLPTDRYVLFSQRSFRGVINAVSLDQINQKFSHFYCIYETNILKCHL